MTTEEAPTKRVLVTQMEQQATCSNEIQETTTIKKPTNLDLANNTAASANNSTTSKQSDQQAKSPTKNNNNKHSGNESINSSPSKGSKNKRRNEARRRSDKKQQQQQQQQKQQSNNIINLENQCEKSKAQEESNLPSINHPTTATTALINDHHQSTDNDESSRTSANSATNELPPPSSSNPEQQQQHSETTTKKETASNSNNNSWRRKQAEINKERSRELRELKEQMVSQSNEIKTLVEQLGQQKTKTRELETALLGTTRACNQLEKLLQQELASRVRLESENESFEQTITKLKNQISVHEKNKFHNDELMRVLNATLMERETEVSILKLKLTRLQTNPSSIVGLNAASSISSMIKQDKPSQAFINNGRSNSEFDRSSYQRASMVQEKSSQASSAFGASTSQLRSGDKDASVWATVPEELTPSKRPQMLEKSYQSIYGDSSTCTPYGNIHSLVGSNQISTPLTRDRRYRTLPRSMKSPTQEIPTENKNLEVTEVKLSNCQITNLDDSNSTNQSSAGNKTIESASNQQINSNKDKTKANKQPEPSIDKRIVSSQDQITTTNKGSSSFVADNSHYSTIDNNVIDINFKVDTEKPPNLPNRASTTPIKVGLKKIFDKFRRSDSSTSNSKSKTDLSNTPLATPEPSPFKRNAARSTMVGAPNDIRAQMSPVRQAISNFQTDEPFAEWDTDMLVDWLTMIGLSMYTAQCRRWVKCGAHIMYATPAEVDKGLGITNHLHRKKLRLAISELNGDCDKITKAAAKLDYLWVARWLDDMGLPQYKEAFINARVDGRVLNYLTVDDLVSLGVKSILHHASIRCGIKVLRSIKFDLQALKRRATAEEVEQMSSMRRQMDQVASASSNNAAGSLSSLKQKSSNDLGNVELALWTCHRVMEWLRMIDFAEFAPNLRGSGVHGGLLVFEDGFNIDTMCSLLSIPISKTLLRRHLATFFKELIGNDLAQAKRRYQDLSSNQQLNTSAEIKTMKKSQWFSKLKGSKVGQDAGMDEYLCPMYPMEPQILKNQEQQHKTNESTRSRDDMYLARIPESINV